MSSVTFKSYRPEREKEIINQVLSNMNKVGALVERTAKKNVMSPMPSGLPQGAPEHTWTDTNQLAASVMHFTWTEGNEIGVDIGTNVYYGKYLELSGHSHYPWLFPAVEMNKDKISKLLASKESISGDYKFD